MNVAKQQVWELYTEQQQRFNQLSVGETPLVVDSVVGEQHHRGGGNKLDVFGLGGVIWTEKGLGIEQ
jgi:hypothetical protein